jgi:single-strand DNA-binding protein
MATINKIIISGRVVRDPELKVFNEKAMTKITIASEYKGFKHQDEEVQKKEICYVDATFWGERAKYVCNSLIKGSVVVVEGRLKLESWEDKKTKEKRYKHVIFPEEIIIPDDTMSLTEPKVAMPQTSPSKAPIKHPRVSESDFEELPF